MDINNEPINVFEGLKNEMSDGGSSLSFDDVWKLIKDRQLEGKHIDEIQRLVYKMQYLIYKKRYDNLGCFLEGLKTSRFNKYKEELIINEAVKDMLFF